MASPLDYNIQYLHYWSSNPSDILFGAHHTPLSKTRKVYTGLEPRALREGSLTSRLAGSSKCLGISICHPIYDDQAMTLALQHAIYSAIPNTDAMATFMLTKRESPGGGQTAQAL
eukprot:1138967-Pelagomonas_calceolata.AAC.1